MIEFEHSNYERPQLESKESNINKDMAKEKQKLKIELDSGDNQENGAEDSQHADADHLG